MILSRFSSINRKSSRAFRSLFKSELFSTMEVKPGKDRLSEILAVPRTQRQADWKKEFSENITKAKLSNGTNGAQDTLLSVVGPDEFDYIVLFYPDHPWYEEVGGHRPDDKNEGKGRFYTLDDSLGIRVLNHGCGIVLNYDFETMEAAYTWSHGDIVQQVVKETTLPWIPKSVPDRGTLIDRAGTTVRISEPDPHTPPGHVLSPPTRKAIREMLEKKKLPAVKVCCCEYIAQKAGENLSSVTTKEIVFFVDREEAYKQSFKDGVSVPVEATYDYMLKCISWFLPRCSSIAIIDDPKFYFEDISCFSPEGRYISKNNFIKPL